jgi:hypothetical protein
MYLLRIMLQILYIENDLDKFTSMRKLFYLVQIIYFKFSVEFFKDNYIDKDKDN